MNITVLSASGGIKLDHPKMSNGMIYSPIMSWLWNSAYGFYHEVEYLYR